MVKVTYGPAIRAVILLILLVVFFYLFFWQVVTQYLEKLTNTAKIVQKAEIVEVPTFTICSGWKKSLLKEYQVSPTVFSVPLGKVANIPPNATLRTIFDDVVFKLNRDFKIGLSPLLSEPMYLKLGMNDIETENSIYKYEVKEIPTTILGMCYAIIPKKVSMLPYKETMLVAIARNNTLNNEEMTKVTVQISSNDTYNTVLHKISGMKNRLIEQDFISNVTSLGIYYTEENTEFIKDCSDLSFFKRLAKKNEETDYNCIKKCVPLVYDSLMDVIDHSIPKCTDPLEKDEYCMLGLNGFGIFQKLKSDSIKQCKFKGSTVDLSEVEQDALYPLGIYMNTLKYLYSITAIIQNQCFFQTQDPKFCLVKTALKRVQKILRKRPIMLQQT